MHDKKMKICDFIITPKFKIFFNEKLSVWSISSFAIFLFIPSILLIFIYFLMKVKTYKIIPSKIQNLIEFIYFTVYDFLLEELGPEGEPYIEYVMGLFFYILILNLINLIAYCPSLTGQFFINFVIFLYVFISLFLLTICQKGRYFWQKFVPSDIPAFIKPFIFSLEFFLFCIKPAVFSFRLSLILQVGHFLSHIIYAININFLGSEILIFILIFSITFIELFVMFLQAFLTMILTCVFLKDMIKEH